MKKQPESLMVYTRKVNAANDESFASTSRVQELTPREPSSGWNAYEVWRTRIWETQGPGPRGS